MTAYAVVLVLDVLQDRRKEARVAEGATEGRVEGRCIGGASAFRLEGRVEAVGGRRRRRDVGHDGVWRESGEEREDGAEGRGLSFGSIVGLCSLDLTEHQLAPQTYEARMQRRYESW